ncbi:MAG: amino acid permease, partial [Actinobacteria bacterium]|nr:amino acid permease [Actinomycetota bacterium]
AMVLSGIVALLASYSYAKLGAKFPSSGGAVEFLVRGYGKGVISGGLNIFQWLGYILALALYGHAFAGYLVSLLGLTDRNSLIEKAIAALLIVVFAFLQFGGTAVVGKAQTIIVGICVVVLIGFAIGGLFFIEPSRVEFSAWDGPVNILFAAGIVFIGFEGFGLVTNTAGGMKNPAKELPKALYLSIGIVVVIYVLTAITLIGNLTVAQINEGQGFALAEAVGSFAGRFGLVVLSITALFATASAVNATIFGSANASYQIARDGELPSEFDRKVWSPNARGGLFITALLAIAAIFFLDITKVTMLGSAAFLLLYATVNVGHLRIRNQTGARGGLIWASMLSCLFLFVFLSIYIVQTEGILTMILIVIMLAVSFGAEKAFREYRNHSTAT